MATTDEPHWNVDDIWKPWRRNCCSPEPTESRGLPPYNANVRRLRRVTRKYEAARRNGHYSISPATDNDNTTIKLPVCLSRVRRKLNFGRKPPRNRSMHENENPVEDENRIKQKKPNSKHRAMMCKCFHGEVMHLNDRDCMKNDCFSTPSIVQRTKVT